MKMTIESVQSKCHTANHMNGSVYSHSHSHADTFIQTLIYTSVPNIEFIALSTQKKLIHRLLIVIVIVIVQTQIVLRLVWSQYVASKLTTQIKFF